jgi:hypothetical protein
MVCKSSVSPAVRVCSVLGAAIRDAGTIPAGHLYVVLCDVMPLDVFESAIRVLVDAGLVKRHPSHLLEWIGPEKDPTPAATGWDSVEC